MINSALLRARSLDEPGAGIPQAGISERAVGQPVALTQWSKEIGVKILGASPEALANPPQYYHAS